MFPVSLLLLLLLQLQVVCCMRVSPLRTVPLTKSCMQGGAQQGGSQKRKRKPVQPFTPDMTSYYPGRPSKKTCSVNTASVLASMLLLYQLHS